MDWKDYKGLGPWDFKKQEDKWGYINNPRWTNLITGKQQGDSMVWNPNQVHMSHGGSVKHFPCGYWHKGKVVPKSYEYYKGSWWQQTIEYGVDGIVYVAGANYSSPNFVGVKRNAQDYIILSSGISALLIIDGLVFDVVGNYPPTLIRCSDYIVLAGEVWFQEDIDGFYTNAIVVGVKRDGHEQYWHVSVEKFDDAKAETVGNLFTRYAYFAEAFDGGTIVVCYSYYNYNTSTGYTCVIRSIDYGVTWGSEIAIYEDNDYFSFKKGDDGNLYILRSTSSTTRGVYVSTDKGINWIEKLFTVGASYNSKDDISVDANGVIYVFIGRTSTFSTYVSSDGGNNWNNYDSSLGYRVGLIEANTTAVIVSTAEPEAPNHRIILRSVDGGQNYTEIEDITALGYSGNLSLNVLIHTGIVFILAYCAMRDEKGWLIYLISRDNGITWEVEIMENILNAT